MTRTRKEINDDIVLIVEEFHNESKMKKFKILKAEEWAYFVTAETKEEAEQKEKAGYYAHAEQEAAVIISSEEVNERI